MKKYSGLNIPFRATSIIPPDIKTPNNNPIEATISTNLKFATFEPIAEFKKFTASFATPTVKSIIAKAIKTITIIRYVSKKHLNLVLQLYKNRFLLKI